MYVPVPTVIIKMETTFRMPFSFTGGGIYMRKIKKGLLAFLASIVLLSSLPASSLPYSAAITAEAHSGRTDARGGHRDNKNKSGLGSYHYHCGGHPAHLHPNGVCPYSGQASTSQSTVPQPSVSASSQTTASSSPPAAQLPQQNQTAANTDQALLDKYQNVLSDFDAKQNGYFTLEINQLIYNFVATGGVSDAFLAGFLTPEESADLYPSVTAAQSEIASKIIYMRLYETFAAQVQAQAAQSASQQTVPSVPAASANGTPAGSSADTQTGSGQDDLLYRLVFQTQTRLTELGFYTGEIDGVFDAETQQALIQFQTACGLTPDGVINQQVITVLGITV